MTQIIFFFEKSILTSLRLIQKKCHWSWVHNYDFRGHLIFENQFRISWTLCDCLSRGNVKTIYKSLSQQNSLHDKEPRQSLTITQASPLLSQWKEQAECKPYRFCKKISKVSIFSCLFQSCRDFKFSEKRRLKTIT